MIEVWLKAAHIVSLAIWAGGLFALPGMLVRSTSLNSDELLRNHLFSRFAYDAIVSPAAVITIATGAGLIFAAGVAEGWLFVKLAVVAGMVVVHMVIGRALDRTESQTFLEPGRVLRFSLFAGAGFCVAAILVLVLLKPAIDPGIFPDWLRETRGNQADLASAPSSSRMAPSASSDIVATPT